MWSGGADGLRDAQWRLFAPHGDWNQDVATTCMTWLQLPEGTGGLWNIIVDATRGLPREKIACTWIGVDDPKLDRTDWKYETLRRPLHRVD
jgi:hypothetical protein